MENVKIILDADVLIHFAKAEKLRSEFVIAVVGQVKKRAGNTSGMLLCKKV